MKEKHSHSQVRRDVTASANWRNVVGGGSVLLPMYE